MSTMRKQNDIDPRVHEAHEQLDYDCPTHKVGDRVRHLGTGEVGIVVRTWYDEEMAGQDCYVCFDDGGNPYFDPEDKCEPYILRYLSSSLEPLPWGEDAEEPWEPHDYQRDAEWELLNHLRRGPESLDGFEKYYQEEMPAKLQNRVPVTEVLPALLDKGYVEEVSEGQYKLTSAGRDRIPEE